MAIESPQIRSIIGSNVSIWGLLTAAGAIVGVSSAIGFLGPFWWFFDLFSHFRVQYSVILFLVVAGLLFGRQWIAAGVFAALALVNAATVVPLYVGATLPSNSASPSYRAMLVNVHTQNDQYGAVKQAIHKYDPDLLLLLEINTDWLTALKGLQKSYPYVVTRPREDNFGISLFSKFPFKQSEVLTIGTIDVPSIRTDVDLGDKSFTALGTHPVPPLDAEYSRFRNDHLADMHPIVQNSSSPVLVLGDLNVTPWSSHFHELLETTGLRDCSKGRGVQPTWPTFFPIFLIPIDHCLHSTGITILDMQRGPAVGSDHYPVIVDFAVAP